MTRSTIRLLLQRYFKIGQNCGGGANGRTDQRSKVSLGLGILILKSQESELMMMGLSILQSFYLIKEQDDPGKNSSLFFCFPLSICEDRKMKS